MTPVMQWQVERSPEEFICFFQLLGEASRVYKNLGVVHGTWRRTQQRFSVSSLFEDLGRVLELWQGCGQNEGGNQTKDEGLALGEREDVAVDTDLQSVSRECTVVGSLIEAFLCTPVASCSADYSFERVLSELDSLSNKSIDGCVTEGEVSARERSLSYSSLEEECKSDFDTPVGGIHLRRYNSCTVLKKPCKQRKSHRHVKKTPKILSVCSSFRSYGSSWASKSRRGSESSTFSCGSQRFRFSKSAAFDGDLSPIVEDDWSEYSDDGFSSEEDEELVNCLGPSVHGNKGSSVLKTYDYEYAAPHSGSGFKPFAITVAADDVVEDRLSGRWSPVSIPPSKPEQDQLLSDLAKYTSELVVSASKAVSAETRAK